MAQRNIEAILQEYTRLVDPVIKKLLAEGVNIQTRELLHYQINTGGKRLRPALAILSCLACGGKIKDVIYSAAGLEILHTWSLIVDDMIDHSDKRRGKPTTWKIFGPSFAQCIGAQYGASLLEASASSSRSHTVAKLFAKALKKVMNGEIEDVLFEQGGREDPYLKTHRVQHVTLKDYFSMIAKKTAALFETSCEVGGLAASAPKKSITALKHYGWHLGMAFQVTDDILDIYGVGELGKPVGQDIRERKFGNIVVLFALKEFSSTVRRHFLKLLVQAKLQEKEVTIAIQAIKNTSARDLAFAVAGSYIRKAKSELLKLKSSPARNALEEIAEYTLTRKR